MSAWFYVHGSSGTYRDGNYSECWSKPIQGHAAAEETRADLRSRGWERALICRSDPSVRRSALRWYRRVPGW